MILVDHEIRALIDSGDLKISPFEDSMVNPASLDYRLGNRFGKIKSTTSKEKKKIWNRGQWVDHPFEFNVKSVPMDPTDSSTFETEFRELEEYILSPGEFIIAHSMESIGLPGDVSAYTLGKSSLGRMGILSSTPFAGFIDCGFNAPALTLELYNCSKDRIKLTPGMKIGQFIFIKHSVAEKPYGSPGVGRYQGQGPEQGSKGI